ncbi:sigma-70 family RNA polymerase sigma factor [Paraflavitalea speifideaquila]|uniref:RNA polymerase sigma factor n=1 Tax=Paraflavitalea speifideaquila TaxID=3076558 RepID=UPI0028EC8FE8|nr:sigma-70 family RNA polymerase sigma factor [Paraflavitalea speifideiaquila]
MDDQSFSNEDVIAAQLKVGNREVFQFLVDQYSPALYFFATRLTGNELAGPRLVETVILKLWKARKGFRTQAGIKNFLYASMREACFQYVKDQQPDLADAQTWLTIWQETEGYIQREIIRAEVLRQVCNHIDHIPLLQPHHSPAAPNKDYH